MNMEARFVFRRDTFELDVDLAVADGQVLLLEGPNGSGKSTLLHLIAGIMAVTSGFIRLGERTLDSTGDVEVFVQPESRGIGLLPQGGALFPHMSALDNVAFGPRAAGLKAETARSHAMETLQRFNIDTLATRRPHEMSGGQRQRVAIARTMAATPKMLLFDEPTTALDRRGRGEVMDLLVGLKGHFDGPIIVVSHDGSELAAMADRRLRMDTGSGSTGRVSRLVDG